MSSTSFTRSVPISSTRAGSRRRNPKWPKGPPTKPAPAPRARSPREAPSARITLSKGVSLCSGTRLPGRCPKPRPPPWESRRPERESVCVCVLTGSWRIQSTESRTGKGSLRRGGYDGWMGNALPLLGQERASCRRGSPGSPNMNVGWGERWARPSNLVRFIDLGVTDWGLTTRFFY